RLTWSQNGTRCVLTQTTEYPAANSIQFNFALGRPETFTTYVRIPAWAGAKTILSLNGQRADNQIVPGKFLALQRTWKDGDRIELELEMPLRLEPVDQQNPDRVALIHGAIALFGVDNIPEHITRKQLLAAVRSPQSSQDWLVKTDNGSLTLRP